LAVVLAPSLISSCANSTWSAAANAAPTHTTKDKHAPTSTQAQACERVHKHVSARAFPSACVRMRRAHAHPRATHTLPHELCTCPQLTATWSGVSPATSGMSIIFSSSSSLFSLNASAARSIGPARPRVRQGQADAPRKTGTGSQAGGNSMQARSGAPIRSLATSTWVDRCLFSLSACGCPSAHQCSAAGTRTASISRNGICTHVQDIRPPHALPASKGPAPVCHPSCAAIVRAACGATGIEGCTTCEAGVEALLIGRTDERAVRRDQVLDHLQVARRRGRKQPPCCVCLC
jgi:hypothetical protein